MIRIWKRKLSFLLAVILCFSILTLSAYAADDPAASARPGVVVVPVESKIKPVPKGGVQPVEVTAPVVAETPEFVPAVDLEDESVPLAGVVIEDDAVPLAAAPMQQRDMGLWFLSGMGLLGVLLMIFGKKEENEM